VKRFAAAVSLVIALILFGSLIVSIREQAEGAADNISRDFSAASSESSAEFNARMAEESRESDAARNAQTVEGVAGGAFLVAAIALFAWSREDRPDDDDGNDNLSILQ
jgi:hypothetical protein